MDDSQLLRYSRHILLPELGIDAQTRFKSAKILMIGIGGLGNSAAQFLAAAGVGSLTLVDGDVVDLTNLQRQTLFDTEAIGKGKAVAAQIRLAAINPGIDIIALSLRAGEAELAALVSAADVILDCSDNFATRHAINRACVRNKKPLVSGAAVRFDGQIAVFDARHYDNPCYHCLFTEDAVGDEVQCASMGVFAPLVGIIGSTQAAEALKLIAGAGRTLAGRLLLLDALTMVWREIRVKKDPACAVCGTVLS